MNAAETIQAAITELTNLRDESTKGKWKVIADDEESNICPEGEGVVLWGSYADSRDTNLVVALHRTIDAQLAMMSDHLADITHTTEQPSVYVVDLARAILGNLDD